MPEAYVRSANLYSKGGSSIAVTEAAAISNEMVDKISGIIFEQNKVTDFVTGVRSFIQEFKFPVDYLRVDKTPFLTGFQFYLDTKANASIKYKIYRYDSALNERTTVGLKIVDMEKDGTTWTCTTIDDHNLKVDEKIFLVGFVSNDFNGTYQVNQIVNARQFTITNNTSETSVATYGFISGNAVSSQSIKFDGKTYYQYNKFGVNYVKVVNKAAASGKGSYGEYQFNLTRKVTDIKKNGIIGITGTGDPDFDKSFKVIKVLHRQKYTSVFVKGRQKPKNNQMQSGTKKYKYGSWDKKFSANQVHMGVYFGTDPSLMAMSRMPEVSQNVDDRYDSPIGWVGLIHGETTVSTSGPQWVNIKFKELEIDPLWVEDKFKIVIESDQINKIYYNSVPISSTGQFAYKIDNTKLATLDSNTSALCLFKMFASVADEGTDFLLNKFRSNAFKNKLENVEIDDDSFWSSKPNPSKYGVESLYFNISDESGHPSVIDSIFLDPITTDNTFHVYYSNQKKSYDVTNKTVNNKIATLTFKDAHQIKPNDSIKITGIDDTFNGTYSVTSVTEKTVSYSLGPSVNPVASVATTGLVENLSWQPSANSSDWESLLWEPVYKTFTANKKQSYVLPNPITAKYIKIEFSNLQSEYYNPGPYHRAVRYQKHPSWILNYFLTIYNLKYNSTYDPFIASQVSVEYDLLNLAYNYYRGDIIGTPDKPVVIEDGNQKQAVLNLLKNSKTELSDYDNSSLNSINTSLEMMYQTHPSYFASTDTVVGSQGLTSSIQNYYNYPLELIERAIASTDIVSTQNRDHLLLEKEMPILYFYTPCRHSYKEAYAKFDDNKAYFVKIKNIKFERNNHHVISDKPIYKFKPGDTANAEHNDFISSSTKWSVT